MLRLLLLLLLPLPGTGAAVGAEPQGVHTDASAAAALPGAEAASAVAQWAVTTVLQLDAAEGRGRDHDLVYELLVEVPELVTRWVGVGGLAALHHDLDGEVFEGLALADVGTLSAPMRAPPRARGLLEGLWLRIGPREAPLRGFVGRLEAPRSALAARVRAPVFDGGRLEGSPGEAVRLEVFAGRWSETWELGGCAGCGLAWGVSGGLEWGEGAGRVAARIMGFEGVSSELSLAQAVELSDAQRLDVRAWLALYEATVQAAGAALEWRREAGWLGLSGGWWDSAAVPPGLLGLHALPESLARALRAATPQRFGEVSLRVGGAAARRVAWLEALVGARWVDATAALARWPARDVVRVRASGGAGATLSVEVAAELYAALERGDEPVAGSLEAGLRWRPLEGLAMSVLGRTGATAQGVASAWLVGRGVHGGEARVVWQTGVWSDAAVALEARYAVSGPGRAPFEGVGWQQALEVWLTLGSAAGEGGALPVGIGRGVHSSR